MNAQKPVTGGRTALFVGNLDPTVTDQDLTAVFSNYGRVAMSHVVLDRETRQSRCYGYVNFMSAEDADTALNQANFNKLKDKEMRVMFQQPKFRTNSNPKGNLFVKNIADNIDNKSLMDTFSGYGNILSCKVAYNQLTGKSLHYGYVHFSDPANAMKAIEMMNEDVVNDGGMYVMPYEKRSSDSSAEWTNCYVGNFPLSMKQEDLQNLFAPYGKIVSVYVGTKTYDTTKVQGFVNFANHEDAVKAVEGLKDKEIMDNDVPMKLYVNRLQTREERSRANQQMLLQRKKESVESTKGRFLYVGFSSESITIEVLKAAFAPFGQIESCSIAKDKISHEPKAFGFVCMDTVENANAALKALKENPENKWKVELAQTREERAKLLKEKRRQNPTIYQNGVGYNMMFNQVPMQNMPMNMQRGGARKSQRLPMMQPMIPMMQRPMQPMINPNMYPQMYISQQTLAIEKIAILDQAMKQCEPITPAVIEPMAEEDRRNAFGERIFTLISAIGDPRVSKITGMMLELTLTDLYLMVSDPTELYNKVVEANEVLNQTPQA